MSVYELQQFIEFGVSAVGLYVHPHLDLPVTGGHRSVEIEQACRSMSPLSSVEVESLRIPRAVACSTVVVVMQPANACNRNSPGFAPLLLPGACSGGAPG
jgi:hypothetical protein